MQLRAGRKRKRKEKRGRKNEKQKQEDKKETGGNNRKKIDQKMPNCKGEKVQLSRKRTDRFGR